MGEFRMPSLGADMDAGTIVEWKVKPGDAVQRGDILAVIDTDKADIDAEAFEDGVIDRLVVAEGEKVPVGTVLATFVGASAPVAAAPVAAVAVATEPVAAPVPPPAVPPPVATPAPPAPPRVAEPHVLSPVVRQLAEREHIDLERVHGTGVGGAVTRADVEALTHRRRVSPRARRLAAERGIDLATVATNGPITGDDLAAPRAEAPKASRQETMQQRTAALMERSNREIPHFYLTLDCEVSAVTTWLAQRNFGAPPRERLVAAAVVITAVSRAAAEVTGFNGWWKDGVFVPSDSVDLGMVVALRGGGLLVPVITSAHTLTATEMMQAMYDLVERARNGHLRSSELAQPSLTVSSLGDQGADAVYGVIYPPQVALVGVGRVTERPWAQDGLVGARPVVRLTLAADHRASDGHQGSRFLGAIDKLLRRPDSLDKRQPT